MGLVDSALATGRNALLTYQSALQIVGQNVANSGNADYTRQTGQLAGVVGSAIGPGMRPGAGVALAGLKRNVDEELENRLRLAIGDVESAKSQQQVLTSTSVFFDDANGSGLSARMVSFFNAMSDVQNNPDDMAVRTVALSTAEQFASSIRQTRQSLAQVGLAINGQIKDAVEDADRLADEIADLNTQITAMEAPGNNQANVLRDRRDAKLRELGALLDVAVREQPDGSINVYVGSEPLVLNGLSRGLTTTDSLDGEFNRAVIRFADSNGTVRPTGGAIAGLITARDTQAFGRLKELDDLAAGIISEVNAVHAGGQGLKPFKEIISGAAVDDPAAVLNSAAAGLRLPPVNGSFFLTVTDDATGTPTAYRIDVDLDGVAPDTSLNDLVTAINAQVSGVHAEVTSDNRLKLNADEGLSFSFGHDGQMYREDSAHLLAALGINTFFDGSSAADIAVRPAILNDPSLLAAATANHIGDGINAGRIGGLLDAPADSLNGLSIKDAYNGLANRVAAAGATANEAVDAAGAVKEALQTQREAVSGVSLDEEAVDLLRFERAFQGAARYVSTVDRLLDEMMSLVR